MNSKGLALRHQRGSEHGFYYGPCQITLPLNLPRDQIMSALELTLKGSLARTLEGYIVPSS